MPFKQEDYALVVDPAPFGSLRLQVYAQGKRLTTFSPQVDSLLRSLLRRALSQGGLTAAFLHYLKTENPIFPIYIKVRNTYQKVLWNPNLILTPTMHYDVSDNYVTIVPEGIKSSQIMFISPQIFVSFDQKNIGEAVAQSELSAIGPQFESIIPFEIVEIETTMEKSRFNHKGCTLPIDQATINVPIRTGEDQKKAGRKLTFEVAYSEDQDVVIRPMIQIGNADVAPLKSFYEITMKTKDRAASLGSRERKSAFYDAVLDVVITQDPEKSLQLTSIKEAFTIETDFTKFSNWFLKYTKQLEKEFYRLVCLDDQIVACQDNGQADALLWILPQTVFPELTYVEDVQGYTLTKEFFLTNFESFEKICAQKEIEIHFSQKTVSLIRHDFEIDTRTAEGLVLQAPKIMVGGQPFHIDQLKISLSDQWMQTIGDTIQILDQDTQRKLKAILSLTQTTLKKSKDGQEKFSFIKLLDWFALKDIGVQVHVDSKYESLLQKLLKFEKIEGYDVPKNLTATLRHYQKDGYDWLGFLYENQLGAVLADDMGLGKTLQAITLLGALQEKKIPSQFKKKLPHLIVVPPSLAFNWHQELQKWYPNLAILEFTTKHDIEEIKTQDIVITTYEIVRREIERLKTIEFDVMIVDEAQFVKNVKAGRTVAAKQLNRRFTLCLSGTPIENHIGEYFSIADLALPGIVQFTHASTQDPQLSELIMRRVRPFVLRRSKALIYNELPEKTESECFLTLSPSQQKYYNSIVKEVKTQIRDAFRTKTAAQARMIALTALLRLRQICISPALVDETYDEVSPKVAFIEDQVSQIIHEGHSVIVFSQFRKALDLLEARVKENNLPYLRMDGTTPKKKRESIITTFQESATPHIFLMSLKVGGVGLNLTKASYIYHLDPWWNPAVEDQASDRAHRIGQKNKIIVTRLIMHESIEEKIQQLKAEKKALIQTVLKEGTLTEYQDLKQEDFEFLLS